MYKMRTQVKKKREGKIKIRCKHMNGVTVDYRQNDHLLFGISLICLDILKHMNMRNSLSIQECKVEIEE